MAKVTIVPAAGRELKRFPLVIHARVLRILERLERWPSVSGAKPLTRKLAGGYRMRIGDYRVQFTVHGDTVIVERIGHRDGFYDE